MSPKHVAHEAHSGRAGGGGGVGQGGVEESRPVPILLDKAARADAQSRRLLAEAHGTVAVENARLVGVQEVPEHFVWGVVALACAKQRAWMKDIARLEGKPVSTRTPPSRSGRGFTRSLRLRLAR